MVCVAPFGRVTRPGPAGPGEAAAWHCGWPVSGALLAWLARGALVLALLTGWLAPMPAARAQAELTSLSVTRTEDAVLLSFAVRFDLPPPVEEALQKGIPLYFVAQADLLRSRWYWRDERLARTVRTWRLAYQPLTRQYRVSFGGLSQPFDNVHDAVASVRRATDWKIADALDASDDADRYIEFSYRLDTTQLPRPMQIGIGGQPEWTLRLDQTVRLN